MAFGKKKVNLDTVANFNPKSVFEDLLRATSGADVVTKVEYSIYYKVVGFKPAKEGIGCSTIVASTAMALAKLGLSVCVLDTSILSPTQDVLLNTGNKSTEDWLSMPYTNSSVVSVSRRNSKVHVLGFRNRTIIDLLSISENEELASIAFAQLYDKYDIFLVDLSNEPSSVSVSCMQKCQRVIQVWSNSPDCLSNISKFVENNVICSCSFDKMNRVVLSNVVDDISTDWQTVLDKYKFRKLGNIPVSLEVARVLALGKLPFDYPSTAEGINLFNTCITDIVNDLLEVEAEPENLTGKSLEDALAEEVVQSASSEDVLNDEVLVDEVKTESFDDDYDYKFEEDSDSLEFIEEEEN